MSVSDSDVEQLLGSTELTDFGPFIGPAGRMYDPLIKDENVDSDTRDDVVAALAAHLVKVGPEPQVESGGDVSFRGDTGEGLKASTFGQMALTLDPTGELATSDKPGAGVSVPDVKDTGY